MYKELSRLLKRRVSPYLLLGGSLGLLTLSTILAGMWHYQYELSHSKNAAQVVADDKKSEAKAKLQAAKTTSNQTSTASPSSSATPKNTAPGTGTNITQNVKPVSQPSTNVPSNTQSAAAASTSTLNVSLNVNGLSKGSISVSNGSNQCNVLTQALMSGAISSLDMRYNSQYKTYAIYAINGVGDNDAVWWTYTVNGKSPPYGCANTLARNGDSVNWQYVKQ